MPRVFELYPRRQGRPEAPHTIDLESRQTQSQSTSAALLEEYMVLKDLMEKLVNEMISQQEKILNELRQMKLHLAGISEEDISDKDVEEE